MRVSVVLGLLFALLLQACAENNEPQQGAVEVNLGPLKKVVDAEQFEAYIKEGLRVPSYRTVINFEFDQTIAVSVDTAGPVLTGEAASLAADSGGFSETNVQEKGVDESDIIKYDGEYLYIATRPENRYYVLNDVVSTVVSSGKSDPVDISDDEQAGIRVMQRTGVAQMMEIAWPKLDETNSIESLYLYQDSLISIGSGFGKYSVVPVMYDSWYWGRPETILNIFDISSPSDIDRTHLIQLDGYLETSRRIDNTLYLITRYTPYLPQLERMPFEGISSDTDTIIDQATIDDLLPEITINDQTKALVSPADCYLPDDVINNQGYANLLVLTAIDLTDPDRFSSVCFNAMSQGIYVSTKAMYISASTQNNETVIHKFDLQSGVPVYSASGFVEGDLGWQNPAFRMSEHEDFLRVVSTDRIDFRDFNHQLYILKDNGLGELKLVSRLPNEASPEKIGKPGENITAVRFYGPRAYVVTFEQKDPLYVLNLEDPSSPFIEGALEIPGFSSYLHPVNDELLLGIGWDNGVKMSLFDVSDLANPMEISKYLWRDAYSPLQHDYKALAFLEKTPEHFRFAFPVSSYYFSAKGGTTVSGLQLFDLTTDDTDTLLVQQGVIPDSQSDYWGPKRAVIQDDEVFYVHENEVISAPWSLEFISESQ